MRVAIEDPAIDSIPPAIVRYGNGIAIENMINGLSVLLSPKTDLSPTDKGLEYYVGGHKIVLENVISMVEIKDRTH